jgi:hypothetical protein
VAVLFRGTSDEDEDGDGLTLKEQLDEKTSLREALRALLKDTPFEAWKELELRFPLPRRMISAKSKELNRLGLAPSLCLTSYNLLIELCTR